MTNHIRSAVTSSVFLLLLACGPEDDASPSESNDPTQSIEQDLTFEDGGISEPGAVFDKAARWLCLLPRAHVCSDGQIVAIVRAANNGEILVSESVLARVEEPATRAIAQRLIDDHTRANEQLASTGIAPVENDISHALTESARHHVQMLAQKSGPELDAAFLAGELLDHARTLGSLDHLLLPSAHDRDLLRVLGRVRSAVSGHALLITEAQELVRGACGGERVDEPDGGDGTSEDAGQADDASTTAEDAEVDSGVFIQ